MSLLFENKLYQIQNVSDGYGFDKIAYVRGTREGYEKIKPQADNFLQTNLNMIRGSKSGGTISRYLLQKQQAKKYTNQKITLTNNEISQKQLQYMQSLGSNIQLQQTQTPLGSSLTVMQNMIQSIIRSSRVKTTSETLKLTEQLENFYSSLTMKDKIDLQSILNADGLEGQVVDIQNGGLIFSQMKNILDKLYITSPTGGDKSSVIAGPELKNLGSAVGILCNNIADKTILDSLVNQQSSNGHFTQTNNLKSKAENGRIDVSTTDGIFRYNATVNGQAISFREDIYLGAPNKIIDNNGRWKPQINQILSTQIKPISEQIAVWNLLIKIYGNSIRMENATANTLVWCNNTDKSYQLIKSTLVKEYFNRLLVSGGSILNSKLGFNQTSGLVVNKTVVPIVDILNYIANLFSSGDSNPNTGVSSFANIIVEANNTWRGDINVRDLTLAMQRSKYVMNSIRQTLKLKVFINHNILYQVAKQMPRLS